MAHHDYLNDQGEHDPKRSVHFIRREGRAASMALWIASVKLPRLVFWDEWPHSILDLIYHDYSRGLEHV